MEEAERIGAVDTVRAPADGARHGLDLVPLIEERHNLVTPRPARVARQSGRLV